MSLDIYGTLNNTVIMHGYHINPRPQALFQSRPCSRIRSFPWRSGRLGPANAGSSPGLQLGYLSKVAIGPGASKKKFRVWGFGFRGPVEYVVLFAHSRCGGVRKACDSSFGTLCRRALKMLKAGQTRRGSIMVKGISRMLYPVSTWGTDHGGGDGPSGVVMASILWWSWSSWSWSSWRCIL